MKHEQERECATFLSTDKSIMKVAIIVSVFVLLVLTVEAVNFKKVYCNRQEFVGNTASRYPHLHCGKDFLSFARTKSAKRNVLQGRCNKVNEILNDRARYYDSAANPGAITTALESYRDDGCPTLLSYLMKIIE